MRADRDEDGRFVRGNQAALGNCGQRRRAAIRYALMTASTSDATVILAVVYDVVSREPNGAQIRRKLVAALRELE